MWQAAGGMQPFPILPAGGDRVVRWGRRKARHSQFPPFFLWVRWSGWEKTCSCMSCKVLTP